MGEFFAQPAAGPQNVGRNMLSELKVKLVAPQRIYTHIRLW